MAKKQSNRPTKISKQEPGVRVPNWAQEANKASELVSTQLYEAHRGVIPWHGPTNMWVAFDNGAAGIDQADYLWDLLYGISDEVPYVDYYEGGQIVAIYQADDDEATEENVLACLWHAFWQFAEGSGSEDSKACYEGAQRQAAADRLARFWMEKPNRWDEEQIERRPN